MLLLALRLFSPSVHRFPGMAARSRACRPGQGVTGLPGGHRGLRGDRLLLTSQAGERGGGQPAPDPDELEAWHQERAQQAVGVTGVSWSRHASKYKAVRRRGGRSVFLGRFATLEAARAAYEEDCRAHPPERPTQDKQTDFTGVTWHASNGRWQAKKKWLGAQHHLGYFDTDEAAARAVNAFIDTHCGGKRQPGSVYLDEATLQPITGKAYAQKYPPAAEQAGAGGE